MKATAIAPTHCLASSRTKRNESRREESFASMPWRNEKIEGRAVKGSGRGTERSTVISLYTHACCSRRSFRRFVCTYTLHPSYARNNLQEK